MSEPEYLRNPLEQKALPNIITGLLFNRYFTFLVLRAAFLAASFYHDWRSS